MSGGSVMLIEDLDLFFPKQRPYIVCHLWGDENTVFLVGCCSGVLGPGPESHSLLPPSVPALHPPWSLAVSSLWVCFLSCLICLFVPRLSGQVVVLQYVSWLFLRFGFVTLYSVATSTRPVWGCFPTRCGGMCWTSGAASSPEASLDWPSHLRLQEIT